MKNNTPPVLLCLLGSIASIHAQLTIPAANGSNGALNATGAVYEIDLSLADPGDALTSSGVGARGIYDSTRWVVVYKYSTVNIPAGTTVTFKNHPSYAPVVWLVQNSVNISGTISLNGKNAVVGTDSIFPVEPGPGGFRGGAGSLSLGSGFGLGPSGGDNRDSRYYDPNGSYNGVYGNTQIFPLIGGSGGASTSGTTTGSGGGGAMMIAATGTIQFQTGGSVTSSGGTGTNTGSGGAIKLVANQVTGTGILNAATTGRVRVEANSMPATITTTPLTIAVAPGTTPTLFPSDTSPTVRVVSVDSAPAPLDPRAPLITGADIGIQKSTAVTIVVETKNFSTAGGKVNLRIVGKYGAFTSLDINTPVAGGTTSSSLWQVNTVMPAGFATIQARATGQ
ncbi:MAG: hypothetical protein ACRCXD_01450 [Luteolibacter sp.]